MLLFMITIRLESNATPRRTPNSMDQGVTVHKWLCEGTDPAVADKLSAGLPLLHGSNERLCLSIAIIIDWSM